MLPDELPEPDDEPLDEELLPHGPQVPLVLPLAMLHVVPGQQSAFVVHPPPHVTHVPL